MKTQIKNLFGNVDWIRLAKAFVITLIIFGVGIACVIYPMIFIVSFLIVILGLFTWLMYNDLS